MTGNDQKTVLMADDDAEDCMIADMAFSESGLKADFSCVKDGIELMQFLLDRSRSGAGGIPDLILLDLNMPRKDGREALVEIKSEPSLQHIPVVILTTSNEEKDLAFSMAAGAESFLSKPATFDEWVRIMTSLAENWLK